MEEEMLKSINDEVAALKDLFLRRLMDDKVKSAAIIQLKENNEALQRQLDDKAISSLVNELLLVCDRIESQENVDDFSLSVKEEIIEILARREFSPLPQEECFDPAVHNAVGTVEESPEYPDGRIVRYVRNGYMYKDKIFRYADVIVSSKK